MSTSFGSGNSRTRCFCYLQLSANGTWSTCLPPIAGISPAYLLLVLENHKYVQQERMGCFVPIWLLSRRKVTWGFFGSSFSFFSFQIKWLCLSALGINPIWQIPVWSHDWPVISKAVATISLGLTSVEMGALSCLEWQVLLLQKDTWIFITEFSFRIITRT